MHLARVLAIAILTLIVPRTGDPGTLPRAWQVLPELEAVHKFGVVKDGVVFRSRAPSRAFLDYVRQRYGVRTVVDLRNPQFRRERHMIQEERRWAAELGLRHVHHVLHLPPLGDPDAVVDLVTGLLSQGAGPILIHCHGGKDRSGSVVALWRLREGRSYDAAVEEMTRYRHKPRTNAELHRFLRARFAADDLLGPSP